MPTRAEISWERERREKLRAEESLSDYIKQAWPVIEPATTYLHNWHIDVIAEYLQAVDLGQILRLVINLPPRNMKSICVTVMWPTWTWLRRPSCRWLFASYSGSLAIKHSVDRRTIIESDWYRERWSDRYRLTDDQNQKMEFQNDRRGVMVAAGLAGTATGKGGNRVVIDDPHDPMEAQSDVVRKTDVETFDQKFSTRLDDKKRDAIVVVMQRLHEADLSAHCRELGYEMLVLPAEAEQRTVITLPISGREIVREQGDLLWEEREGSVELASQKRALGSYGYAGQYQQDPSPSEGGMLKKWWWRFWYYPGEEPAPVLVRKGDGEWVECMQVELPAEFDEQVQSWDMAFKDTKQADFVVGQVWGRREMDAYLLDQVRDRLDFVATVQALRDLTVAHPKALGKLIEDKANGPAVISTLNSEIGGLIAVEPEGGKVSRVNATAPFVEAGNFYLPHPSIAPWVDGFIDECAKFPKGQNDDQVDPLTQVALRWMATGVGVY